MWQSLMMVTFALMIAGNAAGADVFKCKEQNGATVYTDRPTQATADCKREQVTELPSLRGASLAPAEEAPAPDSAAIVPSTASQERARLFETFQGEVEELITQFHSARYRIFQAGLLANKLQARRELTEIRARKLELQGEIEGSSLSYGEQQELTEKLADITEESKPESSGEQ